MNLVYICTNYHNYQDTINSIDSLLESKSAKIYAVIVDNSNDNYDYEFFLNYYINKSNIYIHKSQDNLGYFGGLNKGLEFFYALNISCDFVVIGNNDLLFPANFVDQFSKKIHLFNTYPVISPNIITIDHQYQNPHVIFDISSARICALKLYFSNYFLAIFMLFINRFLTKFTERPDESYNNIAMEIEQGHGACYLLGPLFIKQFKYLYAPTFMYGEEFFLSFQLRKFGYKIFYEPSIVIRHVYHAAISRLPRKALWEMMRNSFTVELKLRKNIK